MDTFEMKPTGFPGVYELGVLDRFPAEFRDGQHSLRKCGSLTLPERWTPENSGEYPPNLCNFVTWLQDEEFRRGRIHFSGYHNPGVTNANPTWHIDGAINPMIICIGTQRGGKSTRFATPAGHYLESQPWHVYLVDAGVWHSGPSELRYQKRIMWRWHFY